MSTGGNRKLFREVPQKAKSFLKEGLNDQRGTRYLITCVVVTTMVVCMLLLHIWFKYRIINVGYEMTNLTREHNRLLEEQRKLVIELRLSCRSDVIEKRARIEFQMTEPKPEQIIVIDSAEVLPEN